jgi:hypothetical protein
VLREADKFFPGDIPGIGALVSRVSSPADRATIIKSIGSGSLAMFGSCL